MPEMEGIDDDRDIVQAWHISINVRMLLCHVEKVFLGESNLPQ
jgi:hypothetical protein